MIYFNPAGYKTYTITIHHYNCISKTNQRNVYLTNQNRGSQKDGGLKEIYKGQIKAKV